MIERSKGISICCIDEESTRFHLRSEDAAGFGEEDISILALVKEAISVVGGAKVVAVMAGCEDSCSAVVLAYDILPRWLINLL